jgi:hypothetical protein
MRNQGLGALTSPPNCGAGDLKIIAAILDRPVIEKILTHLGLDPQPPPRDARPRQGSVSPPEPRRPGRHKDLAPGPRLQRQTAAGVASRDVSARHHRDQGQP